MELMVKIMWNNQQQTILPQLPQYLHLGLLLKLFSIRLIALIWVEMQHKATFFIILLFYHSMITV